MRNFYVDYENVKDSGLYGIAKLRASDTVKIFYSEDAQRISFGTHRRIIESNATFIYKKLSPDIKSLKNALDVLIIHELDSIMKSDKGSEYYIVSRDNDFDGFIEEKQKKKYKIKRIAEVCQISASPRNENLKSVQNKNDKNTKTTKANENIAKKKTKQKIDRKKKEQIIRSHIGKSLKEYNEWKEDIVEAYMESTSRQELNNKLQKTFENEDVCEILKALKNLIKDMPGR